jgi:hypothetical protein
MAKLKLQPDPTFKAKVGIPIPGGEPVEVEFTFKHRDREAIQAYLDELKGMVDQSIETDVHIVQKVATAWELDDPFDDPSIRLLCSNYHGAAWEISRKYIQELMHAKTGN